MAARFADLEEVCDRYRLTVEEFLSWQRSIDQNGLARLRVTRIQQYRTAEYVNATLKDVAVFDRPPLSLA